MQSTENNSEPRYQSAKTIDEVVEEAQTVVWKDATYFTANEVLALAAALAAERDRADRAEAQLRVYRAVAITALASPGTISDEVMTALRMIAVAPEAEATA